MKIVKISFLVFVALFILQTKTTYATDYNYLPPDVLIKQQEQQSALEYRLQKLEAGISGDSSAMISSLSSRISQLESEKTIEKNYISGTYAQYGIANQLESKLAQIDAKYNSQISDLQSQKSKLEASTSSQQSNELEISNLKLQIAQLKAKIVDQELQVNLEAIKKYQTKYEYTDADVLEVFTYIDALALQDSSNLFQRIKKNNFEVADRITVLYNQKYPHGKIGTSTYNDYLKSIQKTVKPEVIKKETKMVQKIEPKLTTEIKKELPKEQIVVTPPVQQPAIIQPIKEKQTFGQKIKNFFGRLFGRNN